MKKTDGLLARAGAERILSGYLLAPLAPPLFLLISSRLGGQRLSLGDAAGIIVLYWVFGFAAALVLGTPLLFWYLRRGWTGFMLFAIGGGVCAAITSYAVLRGEFGMIAMFVAGGAASGLALRAILFGLHQAR